MLQRRIQITGSKIANESGRTKTQIAKELEVSRAMLHGWCKTYSSQGKEAC
ncbi:MAG: hypothetical protein QNL04_14685 [SAR324 cluster bacterium]|nr:hypothetical protein [SAR324 cluster bacterium]